MGRAGGMKVLVMLQLTVSPAARTRLLPVRRAAAGAAPGAGAVAGRATALGEGVDPGVDRGVGDGRVTGVARDRAWGRWRCRVQSVGRAVPAAVTDAWRGSGGPRRAG